MKYIVQSLVLLTFVACGNQHDEERHAKSVQAFKARKSEVKPYVNPASYRSLAYLESEGNGTQSNKESSSLLSSEEENKTLEEENLSTVAIVQSKKSINEKNRVRDESKTDELKALELRMQYALAENEKELALKKLKSEEDIALAKVKSEKEMLTVKSSNQKEVELAKVEREKSKISTEKEVALAELEKEKSKLASDKEVSLATLTAQQTMENSKLSNEKELTLASLENEKELALHENEFQKQVAMIVAGLLVLLLLIIYLMHRRSKNNEIKLQQDALRHKEMLEANREHSENLRKMLEIVADEGTDKGIKKDIVRLMKDQEHHKQKTLLLERK